MLSAIYSNSDTKGYFLEAIFQYHNKNGLSLDYSVAGAHEFEFLVNKVRKTRSKVLLQFRTIRGPIAFETCLKELTNNRGCYVLYNSFTKKAYVGKAEGLNSASGALSTRLKTHRTQPKMEFDTVYCVYLHDSVNDDLLKNCFQGQFLSYLEANIYAQLEARVCSVYKGAQDLLVNQALSPVPPDTHTHLNSLVADFVAPAFWDWAIMTGFDFHPVFLPISRLNSKGKSNTDEAIAEYDPNTLMANESLTASSFSVNASITPGATDVDVLRTYRIESKKCTLLLKNPENLNSFELNKSASCKNASDSFVILTTHLLRSAIDFVGKENASGLLLSIAKNWNRRLKYEHKNTIKRFSQQTLDISDKFEGLLSSHSVYLLIHSDTQLKNAHIRQLFLYLLEIIPVWANKGYVLENFVQKSDKL